MARKSKRKDKRELVPRLRFPEFRDVSAWNEGAIEDIAKVMQGYGFPEKHQGLKAGDYPFYKVSDISNSVANGRVFIDESANYVNDEILEELRAKLIPQGTTIFAKIGEAIRSNRRAVTTRSCLIDNNAAGIKSTRGRSVDLFVYFLMETVSLIDYSGGVVPSVNKAAIENIRIAYPSLAEQAKIADCLGSLDELIGAESRKLEALLAYKKGLMQQLFPREGETVPHLRFPEFRGAPAWETDLLGSLFETATGGTPDRQNKNYWNGTIPWITTSLVDFNVITEAREFITELGVANSSAKLFPKGTVLIALYGQGITRGKCSILDIDATTNQACAAIFEREGIAPKFTFLNLCSRYDELRGISNAGGQQNLSQGLIRDLPFTFPSDTAEQQRVIDCLSSADDAVRRQTDKLEALKEHKKGLMQQLFPSLEDAHA